MSTSTIHLINNIQFGTSGVRGLVRNMTNLSCYSYCKAFLQTIMEKTSPVMLGHDLRPSSPRIASACGAAIRDMGYTVVYAGQLPTPALAYYSSLLNVPCIVVTGSHIPFNRNGLKFYRAQGEITKADEGLIRSAMVDVPDEINPFTLDIVDQSASIAYVNRYVDFFGNESLTGLRIAIYEHSSVARDILHQILIGLGAEVLTLGRTDRFVPIDTEAVRPEDIAQAKTWAETNRFDALLSTDGDGDRPLIGDENGEWLRGDTVGMMCAMYLKADTVVTPLSSNTAVELCGEFRQIIRTRIGSPYVIEGMARANPQSIVVGYEANGGFLLGSDVSINNKTLKALPTRDAVLPMLALLCMAREKGLSLSKLSEKLPKRFTSSDRLKNFSNKKSGELMAKLCHDLYSTAKSLAPDAGDIIDVNKMDGLRLTFANEDVVHLRQSGNAPEFRCYTESTSDIRAKSLCTLVIKKVCALSEHKII